MTNKKGTIVRMSDKMDRLINLVWNKQVAEVEDEKVEDTLKDLINYAIYSIMMIRGKLVNESTKETVSGS